MGTSLALRLALAIGLALAAATACGGGEDAPPPTTAAGEATTPAAAAGDAATPTTAAAGDAATPTAAAGEARLRVVASTAIIANLARRVAGDDADVTSVIPAGADLHSFSPSPAAARRVADAHVVLVNGYGLEESALDVILGNRAQDASLAVVSAGIDPLAGGHDHGHGHEEEGDDHGDEDADGHDHEEEGDDHGDEDADDHDHEEEGDDHGDEDADDHDHEEEGDDHGDEDADDHDHEEEGDDDHGDEDADDHDHEEEGDDHGHEDGDEDGLARASGDPHFWLSVPNAMVYVRNIADALAAADPDHAAGYRARQEAYLAELRALDEEVRATVARIPREQRVLIVFHDAFQYFATEYGLELAASVLPASPSQQASAGEVARIADLVRERGVPAVYREPQFASDVIAAIADATGARMLTLYSIFAEDVSEYAALMRANAQALLDGLAGN